jgi:hypothetical protein
MLRDQIKLKRMQMAVLPLYAALSPKDQMKVFAPNKNPQFRPKKKKKNNNNNNKNKTNKAKQI